MLHSILALMFLIKNEKKILQKLQPLNSLFWQTLSLKKINGFQHFYKPNTHGLFDLCILPGRGLGGCSHI